MVSFVRGDYVSSSSFSFRSYPNRNTVRPVISVIRATNIGDSGATVRITGDSGATISDSVYQYR